MVFLLWPARGLELACPGSADQHKELGGLNCPMARANIPPFSNKFIGFMLLFFIP